MTNNTVSWREAMVEAELRLAQVSDDPSIDARRIIERASGFEGAELFIGLDEAISERGMYFFDLMVERRLTGEPLQYVLGRWGFRTLDLFVDRRVLIPRPETEVVAGLAIEELDRLRPGASAEGRNLVAIDLGTGSGAIGLSLAAERERVEVVLTDESADALAVARANLAGIGSSATRVTITEGSWFSALDTSLSGAIDLIVSNPPYVAIDDPVEPIVREWEPLSALFAGEDGLEDLRVIVAQAPQWLRPNGVLVLEMAPSQVPAVMALANKAGFGEVLSHVDLAGRPRAVVARRND